MVGVEALIGQKYGFEAARKFGAQTFHIGLLRIGNETYRY